MKKTYTKLFIIVFVCSIVTALFLDIYIFQGNFLMGGLGGFLEDAFVVLPILLLSVFFLLVMFISQLSARLFQIGVEKSWKNTASEAFTYIAIAFQCLLCLTLIAVIFLKKFWMLIPFILNVASLKISIKEGTKLKKIVVTDFENEKQLKPQNNIVEKDYENESKKKTRSEFILFITAVLLTFLFNKFMGLVVSIISLVISIRERKNKNVFTIISFIGSALLMVYIIVSLIITGNYGFDPVQENANSQNVSDINKEYLLDLSIGYKDFSAEITEDNINEYTQIIHYIDEKVGIENYYIYDLYDVDDTGPYVISIVLKEYFDEYRSWYKDASSNKYIIMFYKDPDGNIEDYYDSFIRGMEYENGLLNDLNRMNNHYKYSWDYIIRDIGVIGDTLDEVVYNLKSPYITVRPSLNIFVPSDFSEEDCMHLFESNKTLFEKYALGNITICIMEDSELLDILDFTNGSVTESSSEVARYYSYSIEYK